MDINEKLRQALKNTEILKQTKLYISTFIATELPYYLVTELSAAQTEVRTGSIMVEKPLIVTPRYISERYFEGFDEDQLEYLRELMQQTPLRGLHYKFKNVDAAVVVTDRKIGRVLKDIEREIEDANKYAGIIRGVIGMWAVSLMKYVFTVVGKSFPGNIQELEERGFI